MIRDLVNILMSIALCVCVRVYFFFLFSLNALGMGTVMLFMVFHELSLCQIDVAMTLFKFNIYTRK